MTLIKSISGIRGTIGGMAGENLTPLDVVKFTAAYSEWIKKQAGSKKITVVVGRDARISGSLVSGMVTGTLAGCGFQVLDLGLATTPTVEMAVIMEKASGGIIITASHNPKQWNALKLLNNKGEFISDSDGKEILSIASEEKFSFAEVNNLGEIKNVTNYTKKHIDKILSLPLVDTKAIAGAKFNILIDGINSVGGPAVKELLKSLKVAKITEINNVPDGNFAHNPEPLPENLTEAFKMTVKSKADLGIVVDPDVDRLAFICEDGTFFGEEYTLVAVADYVLSVTPGNTVSNLSSSRALQDVTEKYKKKYTASAVGEVNVVKMMKEKKAVIGGEGNGGVIYPELHYGRDALVGIALFLTCLAKSGKKCSQLRKSFPYYFISKNKIELKKGIDTVKLIKKIYTLYSKNKCNLTDGLRIDFGNEWVHLRSSNTEPVIRIYAESVSAGKADKLADKIISDIKKLL